MFCLINKRILVAGLVLAVSGSVFAEEDGSSSETSVGSGSPIIDGHIGFAYRMVGSGSATNRYVLELARPSRGFQLDLGVGQGAGDYRDFHAGLKFLTRHQIPDLSSSLTGSLGLGLAYNGCYAGCDPNFFDLSVSPFARLQYDFPFRVGLALDVAYELSPYRRFMGTGERETTLRKGFLFGVTLLMTSYMFD